MRLLSRHRTRVATASLVLLAWLAGPAALAAELPAQTIATLRAATFEVVMEKAPDPLQYDGPSPSDLMPYQMRSDPYQSIGTAFAIGDNHFITAAHVFDQGMDSLGGAPALRDSQGKVHAVDQVVTYSLGRDFVEFTLADTPATPTLEVNRDPALDQAVFTVGNAFGQGVVIREGLLTSRTPEPDQGAWQQLRYSAAASPGNSGGPLLDAQGRLIGIVLSRSPDGSLNAALPIGEALDTRPGTATLGTRTLTVLPMLPGNPRPGRNNAQFALPLSQQAFYRQRLQAQAQYQQAEETALLASASDSPFDGHGGVLNASAFSGATPTLLVRSGSGGWRYAPRTVTTTQLQDGAAIEVNTSEGKAQNPQLLHLRRAETVPAAAFYAGGRGVGDMLAASGSFNVKVNDQALKLVSFGDPQHQDILVDRWQRRWTLWTWPIPQGGVRMLVAALPVPDGYAALRVVAPATASQEALRQLTTLLDYVQVDYTGTLEQWQDFMQQTARLPPVLAQGHLAWSEAAGLDYRLDGTALSIPRSVLPTKAEDTLSLSFKLFLREGKVVNGPTFVGLSTHAAPARARVALRRLSQPAAGGDAAYQRFWAEAGGGQAPYDGQPQARDDLRWVGSAQDAGEARYLLLYGTADSATDTATLQHTLESLQSSLKLPPRP